MAISAKMDPNPPVLRHYDEPGPDSPREPGDQPDQKLRPANSALLTAGQRRRGQRSVEGIGKAIVATSS